MWNVETTTTVTSGAGATTCQQWQALTDGSSVLCYHAGNGTASRGGFLNVVWHPATKAVEFYDVTAYTATTALTFSAAMSDNLVTVYATSTSGTWTIQLMRISTDKA